MMDMEVSDSPSPADAALIVQGLADFNEQAVGPADRRSLSVIGRQSGRIRAGLLGYTAWRVLHVEKLWVDQQVRGRGLGEALLAEAEKEAIARSCNLAWLDTINPAAARLYERFGYEVYGTIPDFVNGLDRLFLKKRLV